MNHFWSDDACPRTQRYWLAYRSLTCAVKPSGRSECSLKRALCASSIDGTCAGRSNSATSQCKSTQMPQARRRSRRRSRSRVREIDLQSVAQYSSSGCEAQDAGSCKRCMTTLRLDKAVRSPIFGRKICKYSPSTSARQYVFESPSEMRSVFPCASQKLG